MKIFFSASLIFLSLIAAVSCRSRNNMSQSSAASTRVGASTAAAADLARVASDPEGSLVATPPSDYMADIPGRNNLAPFLNPMEYLVNVVHVRDAKLPHRLAMKTVLDMMRKNRAAFSNGVPGDLNHTPLGASGYAPSISDVRSLGFDGIVSDSDIYSTEPRDPNVQSRCLDYGIPHYSDIMIHYYCQIPSIWRACHRLMLSLYRSYSPKVKTERLKEVRDWAIKTCLVDTDSDFKSSFASMFNFEDDTSYLSSFHYIDANLGRPFFKAMYKSQSVKDNNGNEVNVFDYIMNAQTYAFDWEDQNAVINTYYGEMVPAGSPAWDPTDKTHCQNWRPSRSEDDGKSNYCLPTTLKARPIHAIGR